MVDIEHFIYIILEESNSKEKISHRGNKVLEALLRVSCINFNCPYIKHYLEGWPIGVDALKLLNKLATICIKQSFIYNVSKKIKQTNKVNIHDVTLKLILCFY